ncbi:MAG: serine/threonine-protein kinase, partial [Candidatus Solibacter sp.]|nr:serine/threonine-protein kinase [Candidatus Solibacter sp.]
MRDRLLGKYEIVRMIGQGGSGAVYEAIDPSLDRRVAIKTIPLPPGSDGELVKERFGREARITASLYHRNIVGIYDFGEQDQSIYLVMEYVDGHSLAHLMAETPQAEWWDRFLPVLRECADAIDYVHHKGIVHGDIKPANIMVQHDGLPKILDFGLARIAHQAKTTQQGSIAGTLSYLAPEMLQNEQASPQADQYALAVIAYQLATGVLPVAADSAFALLYKVMGETPTPVGEINPRIPGVVAQAISKALSKDPAERFQTCMEFLDRISRSGAPASTGEFTRMFHLPEPDAPAQGGWRRTAAEPPEAGEITVQLEWS